MAIANETQVRTYDRLYIDGEWVEPIGTGTLAVTDAASEAVIATIPVGNADDVDRAVLAAAEAFESWSMSSLADRCEWMTRIADALTMRSEEIAGIISREVGMPLTVSRGAQAALAAKDFANMPQAVAELTWEERIGNSIIVREPVGVVGAITPWNYPLHQICAKAAAALAAGCTIVVKPSEVAPISAFILSAILDDIGLPAGVFNLVTGTGPVAGEALAGHPDIDMVSFTGSARAGRRVSELAGRNVKRVALELGGKSPSIVLDDADLDEAVAGSMAKCFQNAGQTCSALTRLLVPRDRLEDAEVIAAAAASAYVTGNPLVEETTLGPLVSDVQRERVLAYIRKGIDEGAKLICGGAERPEGLDHGYFVAPTVFSDVTSDMTIAQEEIFGPVLAIIPYDDEADAVRIANDTSYGLSGAVWSADPAHARRVGRRMRTGQVSINGGPYNPQAPFGGFKQSGHGRELGRFGLEEFLSTKSFQF